MTATEVQISRLARDWSKLAGEVVTVEQIGGAFYGFCSELGAYRIFMKYRNCGEKAAAKYSENQATWFFRLEV